MSPEVLVALGSVVVAIVTTAGVYYTARQSRRAGEQQARVTEQVAFTQDRAELVDQLSAQLDRLWPRLEQMDTMIEAQREQIEDGRGKIGQLERERAELVEHVGTCETRVTRMEQVMRDYVERYRTAVAYVRQLHDFMAQHLPGDLVPPEPPESLATDLANPVERGDAPPSWPTARY